MVHHLTKDQARRLIVRAQLLDYDRPVDVVEVAEQLGYLKIDPTATIATAEHTILWSRIGYPYEAGQLKKAAEDDRTLFEYDGTFRPTSLLPYMLPVMRATTFRARGKEWFDANKDFARGILKRLDKEGPLLASEFDDTSKMAIYTEGWDSANQVPRMLEALARLGKVAIVRREGRLRVWDLAERVYPQDLPEYDAEEAGRLHAERRLQAAGIAKEKSPWTRAATAGEAATVEGSKWKWRVDPAALESLDDDPGGRVAILNPYDTTLFDRPRLKEVFEFEYVLEQFKPKSQRIYGYFAHPILIGDTFAGLLDAELDKKRDVLRVNAIHELRPWEPEEQEMVRAELEDLARWLGVPVAGL